MEILSFIKLALLLIVIAVLVYWIYRIVKWTLDFKITIKINNLVMEQEKGGYRKGYGGPLIDRATIHEVEPSNKGFNQTRLEKGNYPDAEYDHLFHLLYLAKKFDTLCEPKLEKAVLKELQIFAKAYRLEIGTEVVGSDIVLIPRRPSRPTFDQPKPRI